MKDFAWKTETQRVIEQWNKQNLSLAKEMGRERARARLDAVKLIERIQRIVDRLEAVHPTEESEGLQMTREQIVADKTQLDALFRMLAKVMPDLKAVEHSGQIDRRAPHELSDAELAAIATGRSLTADGPEEGTGLPAAVQ